MAVNGTDGSDGPELSTSGHKLWPSLSSSLIKSCALMRPLVSIGEPFAVGHRTELDKQKLFEIRFTFSRRLFLFLSFLESDFSDAIRDKSFCLLVRVIIRHSVRGLVFGIGISQTDSEPRVEPRVAFIRIALQ